MNWKHLLTPETRKLHGDTGNEITKGKNGENMTHFKITKVVIGHCNIVNNDYQQDSRVLYTFVPNKPFGSLLEFQAIEVWFTNQNSQSLSIEDRINLTLVTK